MKNLNKSLITGVSLFGTFLLFTICALFVDVAAVGPLGSEVAFSSINKAVFDAIGTRDVWFTITEIFGILALLVAAGFAVFGLVQAIRRKSVKLVDSDLFVLAVFYVAVALIYFLFELVVVNERPILVEGVLEASYPSSHTMLAVFILGSAIVQFNKYFETHKKLAITLDVVSIFIMIIIVVGRLLSGMHWLTDIIGGLLLSLALVFIYHGVLGVIKSKKVNKTNENS